MRHGVAWRSQTSSIVQHFSSFHNPRKFRIHTQLPESTASVFNPGHILSSSIQLSACGMEKLKLATPTSKQVALSMNSGISIPPRKFRIHTLLPESTASAFNPVRVAWRSPDMQCRLQCKWHGNASAVSIPPRKFRIHMQLTDSTASASTSVQSTSEHVAVQEQPCRWKSDLHEADTHVEF